MPSTLTVIIPALNEEKNILHAIATAQEIVPKYFCDWEIIVFNDGSTDQTGLIAETAAQRDSHLRIIHHTRPQNLGGCYKEGVRIAKMEFCIMIPGDNEASPDMLASIFALAGRAKIIIPYTENSNVRPLGRRALSASFVFILNFLARAKIRYYNGTVLHRTNLIQATPIRTNSFGYQAEALVHLLRCGHSFLEVGTQINYRSAGRSKALGLGNIFVVAKFLARLTIEAGQQNSFTTQKLTSSQS